MSQLVPTTGVEFQTLTTQPAWGDEDVEVTPKHETKTGETEILYWKVLSMFTRDWRLGNIKLKTHDLNWIWHQIQAAGQVRLLRNGKFEREFVSMLLPVISMMETSQSIDGFFRKNFQTVKQEQKYSEEQKRRGLFGAFK